MCSMMAAVEQDTFRQSLTLTKIFMGRKFKLNSAVGFVASRNSMDQKRFKSRFERISTRLGIGSGRTLSSDTEI